MSTIRGHLERRGYEVVTPTPALIRYWWMRCLREVFDYSRPSKELIPATIEVRPQPHEWAICSWPDPHSQSFHLTHHDEDVSRRGLLTIIVHEIVHAILIYETRGTRAGHCSHFMDYAEMIEYKTGLPLRDSYDYASIVELGQKSGVKIRQRSIRGRQETPT